MNEEILYGRRAVLETIRGKRKVFEILGTKQGINWLVNISKKSSIKIPVPTTEVSKEKLFKLSHRKDHQGLIAAVEPYRYTDSKIILNCSPPLLVLVDGITDPHNLGAIIRSASLCGVDSIIIPHKNSVKISPVVVHTSAGATEHMSITLVPSLSHFVELLKRRNYTIVAAVKPSDDAISIDRFKPAYPIAIVIGSEGYGITNSLLRKCDMKVFIPQKGVIDSFNASVSAGIIFFMVSRKS